MRAATVAAGGGSRKPKRWRCRILVLRSAADGPWRWSAPKFLPSVVRSVRMATRLTVRRISNDKTNQDKIYFASYCSPGCPYYGILAYIIQKIQRIPPKSSLYKPSGRHLTEYFLGLPRALALPCTRAPTGALLSRARLLYLQHSLHAACVWDLSPAHPSLHDGASATRDATRASSGTAGGAANTEPALRAELEALSGLPFIHLW
jgi:hypothetical protein